jgi:Protein of unknown function (DUF2586)
MALGNVKILLQNGALGGVNNFAEGVTGYIGTGAATANIALGVPKVVFSLQDVKDLLIDATTNPAAYRTLKEHFDMAGTGAETYIMLVANTMTQAQMWDNSLSTGIKILIDFAQGRVRVGGSFYNPPTPGAVTNALETDVYTAITNAQVLCNAYTAAMMPLRFVIDGRGFTGVSANLTDLTTLTANRGCVVIGSTVNTLSSSVGLFVGSLAKIPVQRKVSRVKNGELPVAANSGFVGASLVDTYSQLDLMHDKGYIIFRKFKPARTGYYWNGDRTATGNSDDYNSMARGRVIDKGMVIAYGTLVNELDDEVLVDENNKIVVGVARYFESIVEQAILNTMGGQISSVKAFVDTNQNVLATNKTVMVLQLKPVGYNSNIEVKLGF